MTAGGLVLCNPGPMWIYVFEPERVDLPPGVNYQAPFGVSEIKWVEYPERAEDWRLRQLLPHDEDCFTAEYHPTTSSRTEPQNHSPT